MHAVNVCFNVLLRFLFEKGGPVPQDLPLRTAYAIIFTSCYRKESRIITQASMIQVVNSVLFYTSISLLSFTTFSTYASLGNALSPKKVFTAITLLSFIRLYCVQFFVLAFLGLSELSVAVKRIEVSENYPKCKKLYL